jgi:hypothetical protein
MKFWRLAVRYVNLVDVRRLKVNFLEPSGSLQACNGIDLPFYCGVNTERNVTFRDVLHPE